MSVVIIRSDDLEASRKWADEWSGDKGNRVVIDIDRLASLLNGHSKDYIDKVTMSAAVSAFLTAAKYKMDIIIVSDMRYPPRMAYFRFLCRKHHLELLEKEL